MKPPHPKSKKRNSKGCTVSSSFLYLIILSLIAITLRLGLTTIQIISTSRSSVADESLLSAPSCDCAKEGAKKEIHIESQSRGVDEKTAVDLVNCDVVVVPFDPYNACNGKVPQVTCLRTLSLPNARESPITVATDLVDILCNGFYENRDHADLMLCLQTADLTGVLVVRKRNSPKDFDLLFPSDASHILPPGTGAKIIDRKLVSMYGYYVPRSAESDQFRGEDDNMGNAVWQYGATHMLNPVTTMIEGIYTKHADAVVIAAANCLRMEKEGILDNELGKYLDIMRAFTAPTVVLGVGMQAEFEDNPDIGNMTLFRFQKEVLSEMERWQRAPAIGVRGNVTATLCSNSGIANCVPMGCPSLTISHELNLGRKLETNWNNVLKRLENNEKLNVALVLPAIDLEAVEDKAEYRDVLLKALGKVYQEHNSVFILQMPYDELNAYRLNDLVLKQNRTELNFKKFNNIEEWVDFVRNNVDFVISTRIHGAMACIASGTPSVVVPTDYRIMELVNAMSIPHITKEDVLNGKFGDVHTVMKNARFANFETFERNRRAKIMQWREILESAGLEMNPALVRIIEASNA